MNLNNFIEEILDPDQYIYGFADLTGLLNDKYSNFPYAISIGKKLNDSIIDALEFNGPTREYYEHYRTINTDLELILEKLAEKFRSINTLKVKPTFHDSELDEKYFKTLICDFSNKMAATRAGLGWIGKTDLFISNKYGPRVRLATLLTDYKLQIKNKPYNESKCGKCNICVDKCPANAANGTLWNINTERALFFDAFKCRDKCRELANRNINKNISICGICISVCPMGKKGYKYNQPTTNNKA